MVFDILNKIRDGEHNEKDLSVLHENAKNGNLNNEHIEQVLDNLEERHNEEEMARTLFHHVKSGKELNSDHLERIIGNISGDENSTDFESLLSAATTVHTSNIDFEKEREPVNKFKEHMRPIQSKINEISKRLDETSEISEGGQEHLKSIRRDMEGGKGNLNIKALSFDLGRRREEFMDQFNLKKSQEEIKEGFLSDKEEETISENSYLTEADFEFF